jgi:hypothetical protein
MTDKKAIEAAKMKFSIEKAQPAAVAHLGQNRFGGEGGFARGGADGNSQHNRRKEETPAARGFLVHG